MLAVVGFLFSSSIEFRTFVADPPKVPADVSALFLYALPIT